MKALVMNQTSRSHIFLGAISAMALFGSLACSVSAENDASVTPNIVLVTVDTLRADHLGCYGYHRDTSPAVDALAREGVQFEHAVSTMGTTLPAHLSIFTGLYPHQHGFLTNSNVVKTKFMSTPGRRSATEHLQAAGYETVAFVSGPTVRKVTGIQVGFDYFDDRQSERHKPGAFRSRVASDTTQAVIEWLEDAPPEPFFLWVHYWDPHEPNQPPEPYASMFTNEAQLDALIEERRVQPEVLQQLHKPVWIARLFAPELAEAVKAGEDVEVPTIGAEDIRQLYNRYDGDVRYVDDSVGQIFDVLRERELWDESIIAFTSDHGQALGQHDWLAHGRIQSDITHVPLVMRFPPGMVEQPVRVGGVVSLVDLMPTVLGRVGNETVRTFLEQAEGMDALGGSFKREYAFSHRPEVDKIWGPDEPRGGLKYALTLDGWRFYHRTMGPDQLFDLTKDPGELVNVLAQHPERAEQLRAAVTAILARRGYDLEAQELDAERRKFADTLDAIGYTGD